jgi:hypothetical protein
MAGVRIGAKQGKDTQTMKPLLLAIACLTCATAHAQSPRFAELFGGTQMVRPALVQFEFNGSQLTWFTIRDEQRAFAIAPPAVTELKVEWVRGSNYETVICRTEDGVTNVYHDSVSPQVVTLTNFETYAYAIVTNDYGSSTVDRYPDYPADRFTLTNASNQTLEWSPDLEHWFAYAGPLTVVCTNSMTYFRAKGATNELRFSPFNPLN